jgi:CHAT domain-containing protein
MKHVSLLLLGVATLVVWQVLGQQRVRNAQSWQAQYGRAMALFDAANPTDASDSLALHLFLTAAPRAIESGNYSKAADCYNKAGTIHQSYQRYEAANRLYHQAIGVCQRYPCDVAKRYDAYLYIGTSFYFTSVIDSARYYFEAASDIALGNKGQALAEKERLYNSLGAIYFESADYLQAKNYFEQALVAANPKDKDSVDNFVSMKTNIANCLLLMNRPRQALDIQMVLIEQYGSPRIVKRDEDLMRILLHNTAKAFFKLEQYDSALLYYNQIAQRYQGPNLPPRMTTVQMLNDLARIHIYKRQWQQAEQFFDSAAAVCKRVVGNARNKDRALSYGYRSILAERQGLVDEALMWSNYALQELYVDFTWKKVGDLPKDEVRTVSHFAAFDILRSKAALLKTKYGMTADRDYLQAALNTYLLAIKTASYIKRNFDNDESKLFFNANHGDAYYKALAVAHQLLQQGSSTEAINGYIAIVEGYKGNVLYQNQQNLLLKTNAAIPDSVRKREKEVKQLLALYSTKLSNNRPGDDVAGMQKRLLEYQVELSRIQKAYEEDRGYAFLKYQSGSSAATIDSIQAFLGPDRALLNYVVADSVVYALAVSQQGYTVHRVVADTAFVNRCQGFIAETYDHKEGRRYEGFAVGHQLYQQLIKPLHKVLADAAHWVILPDGVLNYLPFEGMTTSATGKEYLMLEKTISYHYSFSLLMLQEGQHGNMTKHGGSVFFAPFVDNDSAVRQSRLMPLPYSGAERSPTAAMVKTGPAATKQQFLTDAARYRVLHLATHASSGSDSSGEWIQFYPGDTSTLNTRLYTPEIYNLELGKASLVILSACETAGGRNSSGEGLLSLSRAFLYAGSNGIISTLWKTDDKVAAYIMQRFHEHWGRHNDAAEALHLAKKDLLADASMGPQYKTPNYWANFVYIGQLETAPPKGWGRKWLWILLPLTIIVGLWGYQRKKVPSGR